MKRIFTVIMTTIICLFIINTVQSIKAQGLVEEEVKKFSQYVPAPPSEPKSSSYEYQVNYSIKDNNKIFINLQVTKAAFNGMSHQKYPAISVKVPRNYYLSYDINKDAENRPYFHSITTEEGYIMYDIYLPLSKLSNEVILFPVGKNNNGDKISFYNYKEEEIDTYFINYTSLKMGDVNGDNMVNAVDASYILSYYAYLSCGGEDIGIQNYIKQM